MSKPSRRRTPKAGESMSSAGDSPARTSALPEKAPALTASGLVCGWNTPGSFACFDPDSSSWRTPQLSLLGGLVEFSETWPRAGTTRNGIASPQPPLVPLTSVTGFTSWLIPTLDDCKPASRTEVHHMLIYESGINVPDCYKRLRSQVAARELIPTPTVNDAKNSTFPPSQRRRDSLIGYLMREGFVPTPRASDGAKMTGMSTRRRAGGRRPDSLPELTRSLDSSGVLNPPWVEWLMGFPIGWTDLAVSATPSAPSSPNGSAGD